MFTLFFYATIAIFFSFLCSVLEAVLLSVTPSYVEVQLENGSAVGKTLKSFKDNIDRPLAGILTLNTIAHTVGAILVGMQSGKLFGSIQVSFGFFSLHVETIIAGLMTLAILILSEIIPKTLGANYWKQLTPISVRILVIILWVLSPFVWMSQFITKHLKKEKDRSIYSRSDFYYMAQIGSKQGVFFESESKIIENLMQFDKVYVREIMTPRMVIEASPYNITINDFFNNNRNLNFSRIPVFDETIDNVKGYVLKNQCLTKIIDGQGELELKEICREMLTVHEFMPIPKVLKKLMTEREQIALVIDEFGGVEGIVTVEDIIETLLGTEILDEYDNIEDMQEFARKNWEARAKHLGIAKNQT